MAQITIIPRSNGAGGLTFFAPSDSRLESGLYSKQYLEAQLAVALGGRLAEELVFGEDNVTTGASNDIQQVANIAKRMVTEWGMSDKVGLMVVDSGGGGGGGGCGGGGGGGGQPASMGRDMGQQRTSWGTKIMATVDMEVERLVNNSYLRAKKILQDNRPLLDRVAKELVEREAVSAEEFQMLLVEYKIKSCEYDILGEERNRDKLPFQTLPAGV